MVRRNWSELFSFGFRVALGISTLALAGCRTDWFKVSSVQVTPVRPSVMAGASQQFKAMVTFKGGTPFDGTGTVMWASSDNTVATISSTGNSPGLAMALKAGTTTISA